MTWPTSSSTSRPTPTSRRRPLLDFLAAGEAPIYVGFGSVVTEDPAALEVLSRTPRAGDVPERGDSTTGRFLVRSPEFLDPAIYAPGRRITVLGTVAGRSERRVGNLPYVYPVISAERVKLWPKETPWVGGEYPPLPLDSPVLPPTR